WRAVYCDSRQCIFMKVTFLMENKKTVWIILLAIVLLGTYLRFYKLGAIPNSLNWDEVSWGYNGYSIAETGRDEWGNLLPLSFKAFGDYKQPVYVYLTAISIKLFGPSAFSVRFPSALLGSLALFMTYFLVKDLLYAANRSNKTYSVFIGLLTSLFLALSPWHIQFSRVAYEANVGLFFVILGVWMFIKGIHEKSWKLLYWSVVPLTLSAMTYHSEKIFTPVLFAGLLIYGYRFLIANKRFALWLALLFILLNSIWAVDVRTTARGRSVTIFSNQTKVLGPSIEYIEFDRLNHDLFGVVQHNRRIVYVLKYAENYLSHFNPVFLYITGDDTRHHAPAMGILYITLLPALLLGFRNILLRGGRGGKLLIFWFFLSPVAAALAIDAPNASRSLIFLPTWHVFEAVGLISFIHYLFAQKYRWISKLVVSLVVVLYMGNVFYYIHHYFVHTNIETERDWQYGYKQAIDKISDYPDKRIFFDSSVEQGYIFYLFHTKYDPADYSADGGSNRRLYDCYTINTVYFGNCLGVILSGDILMSADRKDENSYNIVDQVLLGDGKPAVYILEKR
ncbi:MAG: glycosyltransferase family 39 protein, partial [Candidatus Roizmanbacteria bacterium]|nr:glycosyltransferase family 39 protein [Candidatus Roizmanbacteria bacterium]